jgi:ABC-type transport system substrate-binding protein
LTYTFTLRANLKFSDGTPLSAEDVVATFNSQWHNAANVNVADFADWSAVTAPNASTVVIKLKKPQPSMLMVLSSPWHAVFPASAAKQGESFFLHPVSDGPYEVQSFATAGTKVTMVANPYYWGPRPSIPTFQFTDVEDLNTMVLQLRAKQIDVALELDPSSLRLLSGGGISSQLVPLFGVYYIWMSDRKQPLSDLRVRQAISDAVNRAQINAVVWDGKNTAVGGLFPTTMPQYHVDNIPIAQNIAKAKSLLAGTQCAHGCSLTMMIRDGRPIFEETATVIQQNLKAIGINMSIDNVPNSVATSRESNGTFQMEVEYLGLPLDIPDTYLQYGVQSNGGAEALFSGYSSPTMDALVQQADTSSGAARAGAISRINALYAKDLPYVPLNDAAEIVGWNNAVRPYVTYTPGGLIDVKGA